MFDLYLIRHGEAQGQGRYLGRRSDPPLTEAGRLQTADLKVRLEAAGLSMSSSCSGSLYSGSLYSSPQCRALETAGILLQDAAPAVIDEFAEMDFGEWDGKSWSEIDALDSAAYRRWIDSAADIAPPGGETLNEFFARVNAGLERVLTDAAATPAIIVAHGGVVRAALCILAGLGPESQAMFEVGCASYTRLGIYLQDGKRRAVIRKLNA